MPLLVSVGLSACSKSSPPNIDPFYSDRGGGDYARLPLIKPYEVWYLNDHYNFLAPGGKVLIQNVQLLGIADSLAYGRAGSQDIQVRGVTYKAENNGDWFCFELSSGKLSWYSSEGVLNESLGHQVQHKPGNAARIADLFQEFREKGTCKWFPAPGKREGPH